MNLEKTHAEKKTSKSIILVYEVIFIKNKICFRDTNKYEKNYADKHRFRKLVNWNGKGPGENQNIFYDR